ncbi:hypothetical protein GCM10011332_12670 [Terasakiella brassicae]|uniref:Uncharacterized protein n=1 Tax=Terasakiella brassicae TaxID=1634917 RepID=A0A917BXI9_9PROT|nr:hypothetical protein [Terasakiella brassicae]GGF60410.1 hypothetical protein GCM10011332_12670 [Terasakiella brassicae]
MNTVATNALSAWAGNARTKDHLSNKGDDNFATTLASISSHISKRQFEKASNLIARLDEDDAIVKKLKQALEDAKLAQKLEEQRRSESEALKKVRTAVENAREAEKERARQKIEQIKQEIAMLMMMARINPKAVARRLAQLSKELAAAVKAYGSASTPSSTSTGMGGGSMVSSTGDTSDGQTQAVSTGGTVTVSGANSVPTSSQGEEGKNNPSQDSAQGQTEEKEKQKAELMGITQKQAEQLSRTQEDRDFMNEVRKVKGQLKALIELVKRQLELEEKGKDNDDVKSAEKSLRDVDTELSNIQSDVLTVQLSVNLSV